MSSVTHTPASRTRFQLKDNWLLLAILLLGALALRFFFMRVGLENVRINSDEALSFLQAQHIAKGNFSLFFWTQPYQFPLEAYLLALFSNFLPWNNVGVRIIQIGLCTFAVVGFFWVYRYLASWRTAWPGYIMLLFPSAYWLTRQVALMTPQHAATVTFAWVLPLIVAVSKRSSAPHLWSCVGGVACGLALSNHLLSLSLVAMVAATLCLADSPRAALKSSLLFGVGFLPGIAPYLYAKLFVSGAYERVADTVPLLEAFARIWDPVILSQVPTVLGINPWILPDAAPRINRLAFLMEPVAYLFIAILVTLTVVRGWAFFVRLREDRWPTLGLNDIFVGTTWLAIILLSLTDMDMRTRYALPVIWCFPFLLSYSYALLPKVGRITLGVVTGLLLIVNVANSFAVISHWQDPKFSRNVPLLPSFKPLYRYFEEHGITHCYSGWWTSYRLILESQERIVCSPPYNDRFQSWQQPHYRQQVDMENDTPYVIGFYLHRLLRREKFRPSYKRYRFIAQRDLAGPFQIYHSFRHRDVEASFVVPSNMLSLQASHSPEQQQRLFDGDLGTVWRSGVKQAKGMELIVDIPPGISIHAVRLLSLAKTYPDDPPRVNIEAISEDGSWKTLLEGAMGHPHLIKLDRSFPRYYFDGLQLMFGFIPVTSEKLRIVIDQPNEQREWELSEVHLFSDQKFLD